MKIKTLFLVPSPIVPMAFSINFVLVFICVFKSGEEKSCI